MSVPVRRLFGDDEEIAESVSGTIIVMATLTAGSQGDPHPVELVTLVGGTALAFSLAHVYAHVVADSIRADRRLRRAELRAIVRRESAFALAAVGPLGALVLGAVGVVKEATAVWLALGVGLATLGELGVLYARTRHVRRTTGALIVAANLALGLAIVALKVLASH